MASSIPDNLFQATLGAFAIVGLAVTIGAGHSLITPVRLSADWSKNTAAADQRPDQPVDDAPNDTVTSPDQPNDSVNPSNTPTEQADHLLNLEQAYALFEMGEAIFLDARSRAEFDESHILGAMHLSTESIADGSAGTVLDDLLGFGTDFPLILYCHGGQCDASENTAIRLQDLGFTNIRIMTAGFEEWVKAGYEVETP